jgi:UDP-glucose 4-epimerase
MNLENKTLLITGGTGSFGNAVLQHFLKSDFSEIRILSRDEKKQEDMRILINDSRVKFFIGDVRDYDSIADVFIGVDYVFHAAALKQVPSCEFYPMEAFKTNVLGAENVMKAAIANQVRCCIVLSTDKAVYPINAMGLSKSMMEKVMVAKSRSCDPQKTILCATRYGNVMASRNSVIPLFLNQLVSGQPITITDPNMTRFLMSLEQSVELVLFAFQNAKAGDIFVQKAPACTIGELASVMKKMIGANSEIKIIGTRHGEKLFESLVSREEMSRAEDLGAYFRIPADHGDLNYNKYFVEGEVRVSSLEDYTSHNTRRLNQKEIEQTLSSLRELKGAFRA